MLAEQLGLKPAPKQLQNQGNASRTMGSETFPWTIAEPTKCKQHHGPTIVWKKWCNTQAASRTPDNHKPHPKPQPQTLSGDLRMIWPPERVTKWFLNSKPVLLDICGLCLRLIEHWALILKSKQNHWNASRTLGSETYAKTIAEP